MTYLLNHLKEPSTWAGLADPVTPQVIGGLVAGLAAVLMREQGSV